MHVTSATVWLEPGTDTEHGLLLDALGQSTLEGWNHSFHLARWVLLAFLALFKQIWPLGHEVGSDHVRC